MPDRPEYAKAAATEALTAADQDLALFFKQREEMDGLARTLRWDNIRQAFARIIAEHTEAEVKRLQAIVDRLRDSYLAVDCPSCGRMRLELCAPDPAGDGALDVQCEKCGYSTREAAIAAAETEGETP